MTSGELVADQAAGRRGTKGVVAGGHPVTTRAAVEVLEAGGNAFDAVVAAGFTASVAEPCLSSLGGGGFLLARDASGEEIVVDFFVDAPGRGRPGTAAVSEMVPVTVRFAAADQVFHVGHASVATPGGLAGYLHVHRRFGRLNLGQLTAPARRAAEQGVVIGPSQVAVAQLLEPILTMSQEGRRRFAPRGRLLRDDEALTNEPLASFLDDIAAGRVAGFDTPHIAQAIDDDMRANGGVLGRADLEGYQVVEREPLVGGYRGSRIVTNPSPSFGGALVLLGIGALERRARLAPRATAARLLAMAEVIEILGRSHLGHAPVSRRGTTHVSIADVEGNMAAMTTSNGSCSGVIFPGTGVMANNIMGEEDLHPRGHGHIRPGERIGSMMAPTLVLLPTGEQVALGSGGSERIRSAMLQVLVGLIEDGVDLAEAVADPRVHFDGRTLQIEPGFTPGVVDEVAQARPVNVWGRTDLFFGGVNAVTSSGAAAADHRRGGAAASLDDPGR